MNVEGWQIAAVIKPFASLAIMAVVVFIALRVEWAIRRLLPDGRIKRLLLFRWNV